jgi:WD40 repeat protein
MTKIITLNFFLVGSVIAMNENSASKLMMNKQDILTSCLKTTLPIDSVQTIVKDYLDAWVEFQEIDTDNPILKSLVFSADNNIIAAVGEHLKIWKISQNNELIQSNSNHTHAIWAIALSPNQQYIATGSANFTILIWQFNAESNIYELKQEIKENADYVRALAFSPNNLELIAGSEKCIKVFKLKNNNFVHIQTILNNSTVKSLSYASDSLHFSSATTENITVWEQHNNQWQKLLVISGNNAAAYATHGNYLATGFGNKINIYHYDDQHRFQLIQICESSLISASAINAINFSANGKYIVSKGLDSHIHIWKLVHKKYEFLQTLKHTNSVTAVAISSQGDIASGCLDHRIRIWRSLSVDPDADKNLRDPNARAAYAHEHIHDAQSNALSLSRKQDVSALEAHEALRIWHQLILDSKDPIEKEGSQAYFKLALERFKNKIPNFDVSAYKFN